MHVVPDPGSLEDAQNQDEEEEDQAGGGGRGGGGGSGGDNNGGGGDDDGGSGDDDGYEEDREGGLERADREHLPEETRLQDLKIALQFTQDLKNASLDNGKLDPDTLSRLRNPAQEPLAIEDEDVLFAIKLFFSTSDASQEVYTKSRKAVLERHPDDPILSYYQIKKKVERLSGVIILEDDMCPRSCIAYTGTAYGNLEECPKCGEGRWDPLILAASNGKKKVAQQKYFTIALGPVVQSMFRSPEGCKEMDYFWETMQEFFRPENVDPVLDQILVTSYKDFCFGSEVTDAYQRGDIKRHDVLLMFSIDGAQLFKGKKSDCWIYIWVILNLSPDLRYKKKYIVPGGFIPGPNNPKDTDSFIFPGMHHIAALQKEGLKVWKASLDQVVNSNLFNVFFTADGVGLNSLNGFNGHKGACGCRKHCGLKGRRKPNGKTYYPAHLKPKNWFGPVINEHGIEEIKECVYEVEGCDHRDVNIEMISVSQESTHERYEDNLEYLLGSPNISQFAERRLETGIAKPSMFQGISSSCRLDIPACFPIDLMHLAALNIPALMLSLFRGTIKCGKRDTKESWDWAVLQGDVWETHGKLVAGAAPYLPGSFDKAPRNPVEKLNSGYKAWEFLVYLYGLCPALLKTVLPDLYWRHFCKLAVAIRILHQHAISVKDLERVLRLIVDFVRTYEEIYYQQNVERLHFCPSCLHGLLHTPSEVVQLGPHAYRSQWPMERTIGNLGQEIKQPSNPYKNLSQRGALRAELNSLRVMFPVLDDPKNGLPHGALDIGDGFQLRRAMDSYQREIWARKERQFFNSYSSME